MTSSLETFMNDFYGLEIVIFALSFLFCLLPKAITKVGRLAKFFPILTLASAGFLLAVLLLDFIPHMFPHDHSHVHTHSPTDDGHSHAGHSHVHSHTPNGELKNDDHSHVHAHASNDEHKHGDLSHDDEHNHEGHCHDGHCCHEEHTHDDEHNHEGHCHDGHCCHGGHCCHEEHTHEEEHCHDGHCCHGGHCCHEDHTHEDVHNHAGHCHDGHCCHEDHTHDDEHNHDDHINQGHSHVHNHTVNSEHKHEGHSHDGHLCVGHSHDGHPCEGHSHDGHSTSPSKSSCCNHSHAHDDHDHAQGERNTVAGMICAGLALLGLIAIDQCIIKNDHGKKEKGDHTSEEIIKSASLKETPRRTYKNDNVTIDMPSTVIKHSHAKHSEDIGCCNTKMLQNTDSKTKALIYIFAISVHSFFEGLGMKKQAFGTYEFGIILHKILESFAIGLTLFNSAFSFTVCLLMNVFYSFLTPLGMYISKYFTNDIPYKMFNIPVSFIFNGLALGSLIFIVFLEMIPGAFHKAGNKKWKMFGLATGFILSSIIIIKTPHCH